MTALRELLDADTAAKLAILSMQHSTPESKRSAIRARPATTPLDPEQRDRSRRKHAAARRRWQARP